MVSIKLCSFFLKIVFCHLLVFCLCCAFCIFFNEPFRHSKLKVYPILLKLHFYICLFCNVSICTGFSPLFTQQHGRPVCAKTAVTLNVFHDATAIIHPKAAPIILLKPSGNEMQEFSISTEQWCNSISRLGVSMCVYVWR